MPGGQFDSSKTRVRPVFDALWERGRAWLPDLLQLAEGGCGSPIAAKDLTLTEGYWEPRERCLPPPVSLLSWCVRHAERLAPRATTDERRQRLAVGDPATVGEALRLLRTEGAGRAWYVFEGQTCPDVLLICPDALVVIEGKRTEAGVTTDTSWLAGRHQIWRHIDAAWELRGHRAVYGLFIVEADAASEGALVPEHWRRDAAACRDPAALHSSFPHRSAEEVEEIAGCYLGITTWRHVCERFGIDWKTLPHDTSTLGV